jgi:magnesium transporter
MLKRYQITEGRFCDGTAETCPIHVYVNPDEGERRFLVNELKIDEHTLSSSLDPDELPRLEFEPEHVALIMKRPRNYAAADLYQFRVSSMGLFLFRDKLVIVSGEDVQPLEGRHFLRISSLPDLLLRILYRSTLHYLEHLRIINQISDELEGKVRTAMENQHLINLFTLEKGLVYYHNAIHSNGVVLEKLKVSAAKLGFTPENLEYLDDLAVENNQCSKQAEIFSNIFASLMDARASIVNNNLSVLIKRLTIINVVFLPLNFIAGMGGMSEFSMMTTGIPWWVAYPSFAGVMLGIAVVTYSLLRRFTGEAGRPHRRRRKTQR